MKHYFTTLVSALFCCLIMFAATSFADHQYQNGKIVKIEKQASHQPLGGTDAPITPDVASYQVSIQLGDKVYLCHYDTHSDWDLSWAEGKDVEARVSGKVVYVKRPSGREAKGAILSTSPLGN